MLYKKILLKTSKAKHIRQTHLFKAELQVVSSDNLWLGNHSITKVQTSTDSFGNLDNFPPR